MCYVWPFKKKLINEIDNENFVVKNTSNQSQNICEHNLDNNFLNYNTTNQNLQNIDAQAYNEKSVIESENDEKNSTNINMSAKTIWGTLIGNLRKLNLMTLHTACGEIRDVSLDGFTLSAVVSEDYLYNILTKGQNFEKISFYLKQINDKINIQFIKKQKSTDFVQKNLEKLKEIFGSSLEIR